jgi:hypothetical protein
MRYMDIDGEVNSDAPRGAEAPNTSADERKDAGPASDDRSREVAKTGEDGAERAPGLPVISLLRLHDEAPPRREPPAKPARNLLLQGLAAGLGFAVLVGAGAAYERVGPASALAVKVEENEHLVSTVASLGARLDAIETSRARDEGAEAKRVLGEIKAGAAATRDVGQAVAQLAARVDKVERDQSARVDKLAERIDHDGAARIADLSARLDRLEKRPGTPVVAAVAPATPDHVERDLSARMDKLGERLDHDSAERFADLAARVDKLEKKAAPPTPVALAAPTPPKPTGVPAKPDVLVSNDPTGAIEKPKPMLRGYSVMGVRDGFALIEGREGAISVAAGDTIPGLGRVLRIERRGRDWIVVTSLGIIGGEGEPY